MNPESNIMGVFHDEDRAVETINALKTSPYRIERVHGPFPSHKVSDALHMKKSRVGYFTLTGGIIGFFTGFALAAFTATRWSLIVSGKPIVALVPFFIVGFEFTVLFAVFGNVLGILTQSRLPKSDLPRGYDPRCSGEHFGILASCPSGQGRALADFFRSRGGEVTIVQ
jgi:hypothetical protein